MRWLPNFAYGTLQFPAKVARRLCELNIAAWSGAIFTLSFTINNAFDPRLRILTATGALLAFLLAAIPLGTHQAPIGDTT
jgi:hypothetical protein